MNERLFTIMRKTRQFGSWSTFAVVFLILPGLVFGCDHSESDKGQKTENKDSLTKSSVNANETKRQARRHHKRKSVECTSKECALAKEALKEGKLHQAIAYFHRGLNSNPMCADAYLGIAEAELAQYHDDKALQAADHALALDSDLARAYFVRAKIYDRKQEHDRVVVETTNVIELNPNFAEAYLMRATSRYISGLILSDANSDNLLSDLDRAISLEPKMAEAYEAKGVLLASQKKIREAIESFSKALEIRPSVNGYANRSAAYSYLNMYDEALNDLAQVTKLDPSNPGPYKVRAGIMKHQGKLPEAIDEYTKEIELTPTDYSIYLERASTYIEMKRYKEATEDYSKIIKANSLDDDALRRRGDVYFKMAEYKKALADYNESIDLYPDSSTSFRARSKVRKVLGDESGAQSDQKRASELKKEPAVKRI